VDIIYNKQTRSVSGIKRKREIIKCWCLLLLSHLTVIINNIFVLYK